MPSPNRSIDPSPRRIQIPVDDGGAGPFRVGPVAASAALAFAVAFGAGASRGGDIGATVGVAKVTGGGLVTGAATADGARLAAGVVLPVGGPQVEANVTFGGWPAAPE